MEGLNSDILMPWLTRSTKMKRLIMDQKWLSYNDPQSWRD